MKINLKTFLILLSIIFISNWFYPFFLGYWGAFVVPAFSAFSKNRILFMTIYIACSALGALICASVLSFPMGYITRQKPIFLGGILGVITVICINYKFPTEFNRFNVSEYLAFAIGCIFFTWYGSQVGSRRVIG
jgi:hypothetical protein